MTIGRRTTSRGPPAEAPSAAEEPTSIGPPSAWREKSRKGSSRTSLKVMRDWQKICGDIRLKSEGMSPLNIIGAEKSLPLKENIK